MAQQQQQQALVSAPRAPKLQLAASISAERRARRRDVLNQRTAQIDVEDGALKGHQESGTAISVPVMYMGKNKSGKMANFVFGDFASLRHLVSGAEVVTHDLKTGEPLERAYIDQIVDCRSPGQKKKDKESGYDMEDATIYTADEAKGRDNTDGSIRRIAFRFYASRGVSMLEKANIGADVTQGTFMIINMIPSVWTGKEDGTLAVMLKVVSTPHLHSMPKDEFVLSCFRSGSFTRKLMTRAIEYVDYVTSLSKESPTGAIDEEKAKAAAYRNDNDIVLALGFSHGEYRELRLDMPDGIIYRDTTEIKDANFISQNKENKDLKDLRYTAELTAEHWEHDPSVLDEETGQPEIGYPLDHPDRIVKSFVHFNFWKEQIGKLLITSPTAWIAIAPVNMPYLKALLFARENADVSSKNGVTQARMGEAQGKAETTEGRAAWLNSPAGSNKASFTLGLTVDAYIIPEVDWVQTVGFRVTNAAVIKHLWGGSTRPRVEGDVPGAGSKGTFDMGPMINLSEVKLDVARLLQTKSLELRIVTNLHSQEAAWSQDLFGQVQAAEGDQLLSYFVNKIQNKSELSLDQYAANNKWQLSPQHLLKRFGFVYTGSKPVFQVYAILTERIIEEKEAFSDFLANLKTRGIASPAAAPGSAPLAIMPASAESTAHAAGGGVKRSSTQAGVGAESSAAAEAATPKSPLHPAKKARTEAKSPPRQDEPRSPARKARGHARVEEVREEQGIDRMDLDPPAAAAGALAEADGEEDVRQETQQPLAARSPSAIASLPGLQGKAADEADFDD
jgi:hypothetical protein